MQRFFLRSFVYLQELEGETIFMNFQLANLHTQAFGAKQKPENNGFNFGVITPPNALPTANIYGDAYIPAGNQKPKKIAGGGGMPDSGKVSAFLALGAILLACLSFLPFIRRH